LSHPPRRVSVASHEDNIASPDAHERVDEHEVDQPINGATSPASQYDRAVKISGCTATRISARFAITALHCNPTKGSTVVFYTTGPGETLRAAGDTTWIAVARLGLAWGLFVPLGYLIVKKWDGGPVGAMLCLVA
jgi:hypothetical protein